MRSGVGRGIHWIRWNSDSIAVFFLFFIGIRLRCSGECNQWPGQVRLSNGRGLMVAKRRMNEAPIFLSFIHSFFLSFFLSFSSYWCWPMPRPLALPEMNFHGESIYSLRPFRVLVAMESQSISWFHSSLLVRRSSEEKIGQTLISASISFFVPDSIGNHRWTCRTAF